MKATVHTLKTMKKEPKQEFSYWCNCGSESFYIHENHYVCTDCEHVHTFESVHGSID